MFTQANYNRLSQMWDGLFSAESATLCSGCGMCCHNSAKTLFPGEYDWLVQKTGQHNTDWKSNGCLCYTLKTKHKPIICKIFPINFTVTLTGKVTIGEFTESEYTANCGKLVLTPENKKKAQKYLEYLFSDPHNVLWYNVYIGSSLYEDEDRRILEEMGNSSVDDRDLFKRALLQSCGLPVKQIEEFWRLDK